MATDMMELTEREAFDIYCALAQSVLVQREFARDLATKPWATTALLAKLEEREGEILALRRRFAWSAKQPEEAP